MHKTPFRTMRLQLIAMTATMSLLLFSSCQQETGISGQKDTNQESPVIAGDISNQKISVFAEDVQGHIWMGTFRGLNKYNVYEYHQYFCTDDSLGLPDNQIQDLLRDSQGRLWISTVNGVCLYTDQDNFHRVRLGTDNKNGHQLVEDREGHIFLNTVFQLSRYNPATDSFDCVLPNLDPQRTFNAKCHVDAGGKLWVANPLSLRCYDTDRMQLTDSIPLQGRPTRSFLLPDGTLWLAGRNTLSIFDTRLRCFKEVPEAIRRHPTLSEATIEQVHPFGENGLLLNTARQGMYLYLPARDAVIHQDENGFPFEVPHFRISTLFTDSQKNLWIGSVDQGYAVCYNYQERFNNNNYLRSFFEDKSVTSVAVSNDRQLWIATLMDGLYMYDLHSKKTCRTDLLGIQEEKKENTPEVSYLFVDRDNALWVVLSDNRVARCRYHDGQLRAEAVYPMLMARYITQDRDGTIWVSASTQMLYAMRAGESSFTPLQAYHVPFTFIPCLLPLRSGGVMVSAFNNPLKQVSSDTWKLQEVPIPTEDAQSCIKRSVFIPTVMYQDRQGEIWIGTITNGLMRYSPATGRLIPVSGLSCTDICSIEEDLQGNVWVGTLYGLCKYDRTTDRFTNYYAADGIGGNQFYERASCRLPSGTLVFGGTHGLTFFNPIDVQIKRSIPLLFEDLKIHNRLMHPQTGNCIDRHLSYRPDIRLMHNQNSFSISFAALDYSEHERVHYHYCLEGFDKYWIDAHNNREAYYANLPAGSYTFKVKITNNDRSIVEAENSIRVIVRPAPWATWWARCLYLLLAAAIIGFFIRFRLRLRRGKEAVRRARQEKEQEQRVNRMNMSFFANISHEFRTPLTMISGPVAQLCESPQIEGADKQLLYIVQRSVGRMLRLVNQLMDFNKLENDTLKLQVRRTDIISQLQRFVDIFRINATEKGIELNTQGLEDSFLMWLDADKLDKIVGNLLSNALKFTPGGGRVELSFDVITREEAAPLFPPSMTAKMDGQYVKIVVADTGCGIPQDQLERVFERYYQLNNRHTGTYNWGTGIGLYYARSLAVLHHGLLCAANRAEGTGAVFTLLLPTTDAAYTAEERTLPDEEQNKAFPLQTEAQYRPGQAEGNPQEKQTILITDDDTEVVHYLKALLSPYYRTVCRFDADSAFKAMGEEAPDLVLSDVVMPGKSGYELCRQIKDDLQLCHIPVILVTAKATVENQVEGLDTGADAYVTKPFDPSYLLALIKSLLKNREKVRSLLSQSTQTDKIEENVLSPQDNAFMTDLYRLMENELSNPELDVARMTELLRISRTKFYYKVKGLTGENPSVFFKTYKLNRAAELIKEGKYTVSEIADMTGFSTLSHFSTSFKKQFGVTPSEYKG